MSAERLAEFARQARAFTRDGVEQLYESRGKIGRAMGMLGILLGSRLVNLEWSPRSVFASGLPEENPHTLVVDSAFPHGEMVINGSSPEERSPNQEGEEEAREFLARLHRAFKEKDVGFLVSTAVPRSWPWGFSVGVYETSGNPYEPGLDQNQMAEALSSLFAGGEISCEGYQYFETDGWEAEPGGPLITRGLSVFTNGHSTPEGFSDWLYWGFWFYDGAWVTAGVGLIPEARLEALKEQNEEAIIPVRPCPPPGGESQPAPRPETESLDARGEIAYEGGTPRGTESADIYKVRIGEKEPQRLTFMDTEETDPKWSPDGRRILFSSHDRFGGPNKLYIMDADGSNQVEVAEGWGGVWNPDGKGITFFRFERLSENDWNYFIVTRNLATGQEKVLFKFSAPEIIRDVAWSPDGRLLAYSWDAPVRHQSVAAVVLFPYDQETESFGQPYRLEGYTHPVFSRDGKQVAFSSNRRGGILIGSTSDLGNLRLIPVGREITGLGGFSPDGKFLVFESFVGQYDSGIFIVSVDGSFSAQVTHEFGWERTPDWRPQEAPQALGTERYEDPVRLLVLIPGANTPTVTDTFPTGETGAFIDTTFVARQFGYNAKQWPIFSRNGGQLNENGEWEPNPATCEDTGRSIEEQKQELRQMLLSLDEVYPNAQHILVGHSLGGVVAFEYAKDNPERIAGVIILSAPVDGLDKDLLRGVLSSIPFRSEKPCIVTIVDSPAIGQLQEWSQDPTRPRQNREAALRMLEQGITLVVAGNEDCDAVIAGLRECLLGIKSGNSDRQFVEIPWVDIKRRLGSDINSGDTGHPRILQDRGEGGAVTEAFRKVPQLGFVPRTPQNRGR